MRRMVITIITALTIAGSSSTAPAINMPIETYPAKFTEAQKSAFNPTVPETKMLKAEGVLALVNGQKLTEKDFEREVANMPEYSRSGARTPKRKNEILNGMIFQKLILEQAYLDGIDKSTDVEEKMAELKRRVIIEAFLKQKLASIGPFSETELRKFYDEHKEDYISGEDIRLSKIVVKIESKANSLLEQLYKGENFEKLAKAYSVDSSAVTGGDLGWIRDEEIPQEFMDAVFAASYGGLKEGEVSQIIHTSTGFTILKVMGKRKSQLKYEKVKYTVKQDLTGSKQREIIEALQATLGKKANIVVLEP